MKTTSATVALLLLVYATSANRVQAQTWSSVGPDGGTVHTLVIDPHDAATIYAGTEQGGVFKSTDRGEHWSPSNAGLPLSGDIEFGGPFVQALAVNPQNGSVLYAGASVRNFFFEPTGYGVFRSDDGGSSWQAVGAGIENRVVYAIAIDPQTPMTVYAAGAIGTSPSTVLFKSTDAGASWTALSLTGAARALVIDPQAPAILYAGGFNGVFKSTDGGSTWTQMNAGLTSGIATLALDPADSTIVYAGTRGGGIFKSVAGAAWTSVSTGLTSLEVVALAIDPQTPSTLYAGTTTGGVFKSTNGAATWAPVITGLTAPLVQALAVDPQSPATVYAGSSRGGLFKSEDGASQWSLAALRNVRAYSLALNPSGTVFVGDDFGRIYRDGGEGAWQVFATQAGRVSALAVDPQNPSILYGTTSSGGGGVYKSTDGGDSFTRVFAGGFLSFSIDPVVSSTLYAGGGPVQKSVNAGATWTQHTSGLSGSRMTSLIVDPQNPTTLYAAIGRVFKSETGGTSWALSEEGMAGLGAMVLAIDPQTPTTLYAGMFDDGVFKSVDGGAHWAPAGVGLTDKAVMAVAVDPETSSTVYAGTFGAGVFKSADGGATWSSFNSGLGGLLIRSLVIDAPSKTLYAATDGGGVYAISTAPSTFTLSLGTTGRGHLKITSDPDGIACGRDCTEEFVAGATVTLTARTKRGDVLSWTGCDSDTGVGRRSSCTVTMSANREVAVNLKAKEKKAKGKDNDERREERVAKR